jgi:hypothetical protein
MDEADDQRQELPSGTNSTGLSGSIIWFLVFIAALVFFSSYGLKPKNGNDQTLLYVVIALQAVVGTLVIRLVAGLFAPKSLVRILVRLVALAALCVILFGLTFCSSFMRTGWLGT